MFTRWALNNSMLVLILVVMIIAAGPLSFLSHPSREDPEITIRTALVTASFAGMSPRRIEDLITKTLEEKVREMPEVKRITTTSRSGQTTVRVELHDRIKKLEPVWQDLRNKMDDVKSSLPSGTSGPFVNDNYGDVAMATIALTAEGFTLAEMRESARNVRDKLYSVSGISKVELFGVEPERIFVEVNNVRLSQLGISPQALIDTVNKTNIVSPGGRIEAGISSFAIEPTGNFDSLDDIGQVTVEIPDRPGQVIYLRDFATIRRDYVDPPKNPAFYNGKPAIVIGVQMVDKFDSKKFAKGLQDRVQVLKNGLPIGYQLRFITFQPDDIRKAVDGVAGNLYQTIGIVLLVVMLFLGWRTGLIVGAMVPITMLLTILIMRYVGIELERMSLAALIISLGLLVDNGIVMAEEIGRRLAIGEERKSAAIETGKAMALPLLSSSMTTILAFMPLMLAENSAGEYLRSLSLVIAIALLASWALAMTVTPLLCVWGLKTPKPVDEDAAYNTAFYRAYKAFLDRVLRWRYPFLVAVVASLFVAVWGLKFVPKIFFPTSDRVQLQVYVDLPVGSNTYGSKAATLKLAAFLSDKKANPEITNNVAYVASGGPRFHLGLNPIDPDPHRSFLIVNVQDSSQIQPMRVRIEKHAAATLPEARVIVKPMSLGGNEVGLVEYRIVGDDPNELSRISGKLKSIMRNVNGTTNIKDDWENRLVKIIVDVNQARARRAGVTSQSVADTLDALLAGIAVTDYRDGDTVIPVYLRAEGAQRTNIDRLRTLNITRAGGQAVPLMQVANFEGYAEFSMIQRRDLERVITVSGKSLIMPAAGLDAVITPELDKLKLPPGYRIERGGEIEGSSEARSSLFANMPLAFALIVLILVGQFNSLRKPLVIVAVIPLVMIGVSPALIAMPGANFSFIATLGLLSLAGIIINNAIVLIDRIDTEQAAGLNVHDAIITASVKRLRPILMTTITTVLGLFPLILWRDILFYDLAVVVSGGLAVGTVLTLGVVPVLYHIMFRDEAGSTSPGQATEATGQAA